MRYLTRLGNWLTTLASWLPRVGELARNLATLPRALVRKVQVVGNVAAFLFLCYAMLCDACGQGALVGGVL